MHSIPKHPCRHHAILTVALVACGGMALLFPSAVEANVGTIRSVPSSSSSSSSSRFGGGGSVGSSPPASGSDSAPTLRMDFGPAKNMVVNGGKMSGKASNTLDLYPHGFAYSDVRRRPTRADPRGSLNAGRSTRVVPRGWAPRWGRRSFLY